MNVIVQGGERSLRLRFYSPPELSLTVHTVVCTRKFIPRRRRTGRRQIILGIIRYQCLCTDEAWYQVPFLS